MLLIVLLVFPAAAAVVARRRVREVLRRYGGVPNSSGATGSAVAEYLLAAHGVTDTAVRTVSGTLADHYDPRSRVLALSPAVADQPSVAALGIAAHEVGHALQDAGGSLPLTMRMRLSAALGRISPFAGLLFVGGFLFGVPLLAAATGVFLLLMVVLAVVALPTELDASRRAVRALETTGLAVRQELPAVRRVLRAAALTYVAALGHRLGMLLFLAAGIMLAQRAS